MMRACRRCAVLVAAIAFVATGTLALASTDHEGTTLAQLDQDGVILRGRDGATIEVPAARLVAWGRCPPLPLGPHVVLADGGMIAGTLASFDGTTATVRSWPMPKLVAHIANVPVASANKPAAASVGTATSRPTSR